ncbi:MAG: sulfotransferase, partial [Sneathiella sp.]|nr:sulfotransferase [Sneathiella sp.]
SALKADAGSARYVVDTMPSNFPYIGLIFRAFPKVKVLTCQRHLLDNCLYAYFQRYQHANTYSYNLQDTAAFFADYHQMISHWNSLFGDRILTQTYEDLVIHPVDTAKKIFKFCDLDFKEEWAPTHLTDKEIGRWHAYTDELAPLIEWLEQQ